ncbi:MAG: S41 family peptidase [Candidatus Eisenbacteria bacterium]
MSEAGHRSEDRLARDGDPPDFACVLDEVSRNYAGYRDKVRGREAELGVLTESVRASILSSRGSPDERIEILRSWLVFFRDRHLGLSSATGQERFERDVAAGRLDPTLARLDDEALLLTIPTFGAPVRERLDALLAAAREELSRTPVLLIDIRGNGGGSDATFESLLPWIATGPIRVTGCDYWATPANAACIRSYAAQPGMPAEYVTYLCDLAARMEAAPGTFVDGPPDRIDTFDELHPLPERIGILMDRRCASAAEAFALLARQSGKVRLFGENTRGSLDYSNLRRVRLPSGAAILVVPMSRARWLPGFSVDAEGIAPDVAVPPDAADAIALVRARL